MNLRIRKGFILALTLALTLIGSSVAKANTNVDFAFSFHDALAPYGTWVQVSSYGQVWRPRASAGFVPYTEGHWAYTNYGPTWVGSEPWAWCAYHYGQWIFTPEFGWVWVPGYEWTPGRVAWATGPGYIGWSPYLGGGNPNVNFWVVINRDRFGYSNYSRYVLRRDTARNLFDRRLVRLHSGPLQRIEAERITRRSIHVVPVNVRQVVADRRNTKLVLLKGHETVALKQISHVSKKSTASLTTKKAIVEKKVVERKPVTEVSEKSSSKFEHHKVEPAIAVKTSSKVLQQQHKVELPTSAKKSSKTVKKMEPAKIQPKGHSELTSKSQGSKKVENVSSKAKETSPHEEVKVSQHNSTSSKSKPSSKSSNKSKRKPPHA